MEGTLKWYFIRGTSKLLALITCLVLLFAVVIVRNSFMLVYTLATTWHELLRPYYDPTPP